MKSKNKCNCPTKANTFAFENSKYPLKEISEKFKLKYRSGDKDSHALILSCSLCKGHFVAVQILSGNKTKIEIVPIDENELNDLLSRTGELDYMCHREGPYYILYG